MTGFIVRRLLSATLVVVLTSLFVFALFFKGMGDAPAINYCEQLGPGKCTPTKLHAIELCKFAVHGPVRTFSDHVGHADRRRKIGHPRVVTRQSDIRRARVDQHVDQVPVDPHVGIEMAVGLALKLHRPFLVRELRRILGL